MPDVSQIIPEGTMLRDYRIIRSPEQSEFGNTYLAEDVTTGATVVIKEHMPRPFAYRHEQSYLEVKSRKIEGAEENFKWSKNIFLHEAADLAKLNHRCVVKVLATFDDLGTSYYVMPYIEGISPEDYRHHYGAPSEEWVKFVLEELLHALAYLHGKGILHRDIKPSHILLTNAHKLILVGFGTARQLIGEHAHLNTESAGYTPFEQTRGSSRTGVQSDLYALGATMYMWITGQPPMTSIDRVGKYDPQIPLVARPNLVSSYSPELLAGIDKAMAVWPEDRWQSATEWLSSLDLTDTDSVIYEEYEELKHVPNEVTQEKEETDKKGCSSLFLKILLVSVIVIIIVLLTIMAIRWQ